MVDSNIKAETCKTTVSFKNVLKVLVYSSALYKALGMSGKILKTH